jgi:hypothetical protein
MHAVCVADAIPLLCLIVCFVHLATCVCDIYYIYAACVLHEKAGHTAATLPPEECSNTNAAIWM